MYYWQIKHDFVSDELGTAQGRSYLNTKDVTAADMMGEAIRQPTADEIKNADRFQMLDDDGVLYFSGTICGDDYDGFEPLDDFGAAFGCTTIKINGRVL
jgi:hypothetical protein